MEDKKEAFLSNSLDRLKTSLEVEGSGRGGSCMYAWGVCICLRIVSCGVAERELYLRLLMSHKEIRCVPTSKDFAQNFGKVLRHIKIFAANGFDGICLLDLQTVFRSVGETRPRRLKFYEGRLVKRTPGKYTPHVYMV